MKEGSRKRGDIEAPFPLAAPTGRERARNNGRVERNPNGGVVRGKRGFSGALLAPVGGTSLRATQKCRREVEGDSRLFRTRGRGLRYRTKRGASRGEMVEYTRKSQERRNGLKGTLLPI